MYKVLRPTKDTYITNRVVKGKVQSGSNVGQAGSLDLFKLYGVTLTNGVPNVELSRLLIHYDLQPLRDLVDVGRVDPGNPSFNVTLKLFDVNGGQPLPARFTINVNPLSRSFDEGLGRDVVYYSDYDVCNFATGSRAQGAWAGAGCSSVGVDYISSPASQFFTKGDEDLSIDVTTIVSSTLAGLLPDEGFRISLADALETDNRSYFVKRFAGRAAFNVDKRPRLIVKFDDSIQDDSQSLTFDSSGTLFLYNYSQGSPRNLMAVHSYISSTFSSSLTITTYSGYFSGTVAQGSLSSSTTLNGLVTGSTTNLTLTTDYSGSFPAVIFGTATFGSLTATSGSFGNLAPDSLPTSLSVISGLVSGTIITGTIGAGFISDAVVVNMTFNGALMTDQGLQYPVVISGNNLLGSFTTSIGPTDGEYTILNGELTGTLISGSVGSGSFSNASFENVSFFGSISSGTIINYTSGTIIYPVGNVLVPVTGSNSLILKLAAETAAGWTTYSFTGSQHTVGTFPVVGVYSASVYIPSSDPLLAAKLAQSGSIKMTPIWGSIDGATTFLMGAPINVDPSSRGSISIEPHQLVITVHNVQERYFSDEEVTLRVNLFDITSPTILLATRLPVERPGSVIRDVHYQVRDDVTGVIEIPFDTRLNSTRLSSDASGMFFKFDMSNLTVDRSYVFDIMVITSGIRRVYKGSSPIFRVSDVR